MTLKKDMTKNGKLPFNHGLAIEKERKSHENKISQNQKRKKNNCRPNNIEDNL